MDNKTPIEALIKVSTDQLHQQLEQSCKDLETGSLNSDLAGNIIKILQDSLAQAGQAGLKSFLESYDIKEKSLKKTTKN